MGHLQTSLSTAEEELDKWKSTFTNDPLLPKGVLAGTKHIVFLHLSRRSRVNQVVMCRAINSSNKLTHGPYQLTGICVIPYFASSIDFCVGSIQL